MDPSRRIKIAFPSSTEYLSLVRSTVGWICAKCDFDEQESARTVLAVVEAVTNIIRHAYEGAPDETIELCVTELPKGIEIELLDRGKSVSPQQLVPRNVPEFYPGGRGVQMMKSCVDVFHYEARPDGGSRLLLKKLRGRQTGEPGEDSKVES